jgi:hypothetical protein
MTSLHLLSVLNIVCLTLVIYLWHWHHPAKHHLMTSLHLLSVLNIVCAYLDGVSVTENITKVRHTMFSTDRRWSDVIRWCLAGWCQCHGEYNVLLYFFFWSLLAILLSVLLQYTDSDCPFSIFKLFFDYFEIEINVWCPE